MFDLDLTDEFLKPGRHHTPMGTAGALLEHYFGALDDKTFLRRLGTPAGGGDDVFQWASNRWLDASDHRVVVWGFVVVNPPARRAKVVCHGVAE